MDSSPLTSGILMRMTNCLLGLLVMGICCIVQANEDRVAILLSGKAGFYQKAAEQLTQTLNDDPSEHVSVDIFELPSVSAAELDKGKYRLLVSVGSDAAQYALSRTSGVPLLAIFLPRSGFKKIIAENRRTAGRALSVIYLDQPPSRFVQLAKLLQPSATDIGTVLGPVSGNHLDELKKASKDAQLLLHHAEINVNDNPLDKLQPVIEKSDVFIAVADSAFLNGAVAKWILYLSFQDKIPVIGFSSAYTKAGALASVYTSPENVGVHAGELISRWLKSGDNALWKPHYPAYCTVSLNPAVARALEIKLPAVEALQKQLENMDVSSDE